ncbi:MAG: hypothetical protein JWN40_378 [Phycisphaerales bacterium]|nr:hypothetical protein [Phycisphaerales bacterium]
MARKQRSSRINAKPETIELPVFIPGSSAGLRPATAEGLKGRVMNAFSAIFVDELSLDAALGAVGNLVTAVGSRLQASRLSLDTIEVELGVSATGKVGFLGSGVEAEVAASIVLGFKLSKAN